MFGLFFVVVLVLMRCSIVVVCLLYVVFSRACLCCVVMCLCPFTFVVACVCCLKYRVCVC